jgi:hypothetical protein
LHLIISLINIFNTSLAEAISGENSHVDQLRSFVDEVTREVAIMQDKFDHQDALHEAFGDIPTTIGVAASKAKLDKCEERLISPPRFDNTQHTIGT